jgi:hypothetical protein
VLNHSSVLSCTTSGKALTCSLSPARANSGARGVERGPDSPTIDRMNIRHFRRSRRA